LKIPEANFEIYASKVFVFRGQFAMDNRRFGGFPPDI